MGWLLCLNVLLANIWSSLLGCTLFFYETDGRSGIDHNSIPKHAVWVENSIVQAVPEHPKKDFVFCLSNSLGDAFLFQVGFIWEFYRVVLSLFLSLLHPTDQGGNLSSGSKQWKNPADSGRFGFFLWQYERKDMIYLVNSTQETHHHIWITVWSAVFIVWLDPLYVDDWNKVRIKKYSHIPVKTGNFAWFDSVLITHRPGQLPYMTYNRALEVL